MARATGVYNPTVEGLLKWGYLTERHGSRVLEIENSNDFNTESVMTGIMFVDDEFEVLEAIRRNLRPFRNEWHLDFVTSAEHALQKMAAEPADVVVTDMRMTAMQGDALIETLLTDYPRVVPNVLSGCVDPEITAKLDKVGIRLLVKPCTTETLVETIRETLSGLEVAQVAASPAGAIFDSTVDLEDYLLFLAEGLILGGHVEEGVLPALIRDRLNEYRRATYSQEARRPVRQVGLPPGRVEEIPVRIDDVVASRQAANGWVEMIHDRYAS